MQLARRRVHSGKVVTMDVDTVRFPNGTTGELEIVRHPGAAAVVPILSDPSGPDPAVLLIHQYRYATNGSLFEIPAGRLDAGEQPIDCARRELLEETGVTAGRLEPLTTIWTTPGFTDERIHLFWAADLKSGAPAREEDEFIEVVSKPLSQVITLIKNGGISDAKTVVGILYVSGFILGH